MRRPLADQNHPYDDLSPDVILDAIESAGYSPDGGMLALNSYENRVYQIGIEDSTPLVAKFYRPHRWSRPCIEEEHQFSLQLEQAEVPVVAPLKNSQGETLFKHHDFKFALFPRRGGRWPELEDLDNLEWIGRFLGRIHQTGSTRSFEHRPEYSVQRLGVDPAQFLLGNNLLPIESATRYKTLTDALLENIAATFSENPYQSIRLHGDCHPGNILWTEQGPHFVDMDDCCNGPAIQDLWMLLSGDRTEQTIQLDAIREGYETFRPLNHSELNLIEPLRTLRMIHYAAWLAKRWSDPAFPLAFPWFNTQNYWQDHLMQLEHQLKVLGDPPLSLF